MKAYRMLIDIIHAMSRDPAIAVTPVDQLLTTQRSTYPPEHEEPVEPI